MTEEQYGHQVLEALTQRFPLDYDHPRRQNVEDIVQRLTKAASADQDPWHLFVFKDPSFKNAAATRGNHVFVWTAMIDATKNDDELAAVLAHEISHVLARHTDPDPNEELKKMLINVGAVAAGIAAAHATGSPQWGQTAGDLATQVTGAVGQGVFLNPYSREREFEADQIGLFLMADGGYDPRAAVEFWSRAQSDPSFGSSLEFFSTHPPAGARLNRLKTLLPEAQARFEGRVPKPRPLDLRQWTAQSTGSQGGTSTGSTLSGSPSSTASGRSWEVVDQRAILYRYKDSSGPALGEFTRGARVYPIAEERDWLELADPERGFLRKEALAPRP